MKLAKVILENFQSYDAAEFDYSDLGLALVSGETGAGKSTFLDGPSWGLFGVTSKDGAADDVRAWGVDAPTKVITEVQLPDGALVVTRVRGKPTQNDLFWTENGGEPIRGKDMKETQKLLEKRLGMTADLFLTSSYMTQFMDGGKFFTATSKERRGTLDKIADLQTPNLLAERASEARKGTKKDLEAALQDSARAQGRVETLVASLTRTEQDYDAWEGKQAARLADLTRQAEGFEADRNSQVDKLVTQLESLDAMIKEDSEFSGREKQSQDQLKALTPLKAEKKDLEPKLRTARVTASTLKAQREKLCSLKGDACPVCLGPTQNPNMSAEVARLKHAWVEAEDVVEPMEGRLAEIEKALAIEDTLRRGLDKIAREKAENLALVNKFRELQAKILGLRDSVNRYEAMLEQAKKETNPHAAVLTRIQGDLNGAQHASSNAGGKAKDLQHRAASLTWLYDQAFALRGMLLQKAVRSLNKRMNEILERYFDAGIRVTLTLADGDSLDVEIQNSGYPCKFAQLSGGERAQLKLAFSIALLEASQNIAGRKFETVMFDEALNGMSDSLKRKAFGVFQELAKEHGTVLLIDHCEEIKNFFPTQFHVSKHGSVSTIEELHG